MHVANDSDNLSRLFLGRIVEAHTATDRILVLPEPSRHRLVDHDHPGMTVRVLLRHASAPKQWNAHEPKIAGTDRLSANGRFL